MERAGTKSVSASSAALAEFNGGVSYLETEHQKNYSQGTASMPFSKALLTYWKQMLAKPPHLRLKSVLDLQKHAQVSLCFHT